MSGNSRAVDTDGWHEPVPGRRGPWGFWASLGWALLGYLIIAGIQVAVVVALVARAGSYMSPQTGTALSLSVWLAVPPVLGLAALAVAVRRGPTLVDYLGLRWVGVWRVLGWVGLAVAVSFVGGLVDELLQRQPVPDFLYDAYTTAASLPLLASAVIVGAPLMEEPLFRGLVLKGWSQSRIGPVWGVVLLSVLWALVHVQYDLYNMTQIFVIGMLLGWARVRTDSLWPPLAMHATLNLLGMLQTAYYLD